MECNLLNEPFLIEKKLTLSLVDCTAFILADQNVSKEKQQFYIVLFTKRTSGIKASNVANSIFGKSQNPVVPIILVHKLSDLNTKQSNQLRFFDWVLRSGSRICFDKFHYPFLPVNKIPNRDYDGDNRFWLKCVAVAQFNIQAAKDSGHSHVELCRIALLNAACVQLALGLIRIFMEYTPNQFGLRYLLDLCGYFSDLPERIFNISTPENARRFKMLCAPSSMLNHWIKLNAEEADFLYLLDAAQQFLKLSEELVGNEWKPTPKSIIH